MLFVNALAGGLLTLAAPILAIVLKSKIAGDIRIQAKEKVPAAVGASRHPAAGGSGADLAAVFAWGHAGLGPELAVEVG